MVKFHLHVTPTYRVYRTFKSRLTRRQLKGHTRTSQDMSGIQRKGASDPYLSNSSGLGLVASKRNVKLELLNEQRDEINDAFDMFDMNHDGFLDYHEAKVAFRALGFDLGKRQVLDIIREYDVDNRNLIGFENFAETGMYWCG